MTTANEKGLLLEEGVRFIEEHILRAESQVKDSDLAIETRKIVTHLGVRHEIDLYVRINGARSYDAVFIFECKNWQEKVGKNEIVVFSEKIRVTAAQRGFFVATGFTQDAVAQAALDPRIELVLATAQELAEVVNLTYFHVLAVAYQETSLDLFETGVTEAERTKLQIDFDTATATLDSRPINLKAYVLEWQNDAQNRRTAKWGSPLQPAGEYQLVTHEERAFTDGQLVVNGRGYSSAKLHVVMLARIIRPGVRARVDVNGRGSAFQLESVKVGDGEMRI